MTGNLFIYKKYSMYNKLNKTYLHMHAYIYIDICKANMINDNEYLI